MELADSKQRKTLNEKEETINKLITKLIEELKEPIETKG
jgi:hypothetical protein